MTRGEIWMFRFAPPDPPSRMNRARFGGAGKQRPVLVLTRADMIGVLNTVTVAPLTRTIRGAPSEVLVDEGSGLKEPSAINLHHVITVPKDGLRRFVGTVSPEVFGRVRAALLFALGFNG